MSSNLSSDPIVAIQDLRFRYPGMRHDALRLSRLEIDRPGLIAITGPSGAGKSTLVELVAGTLNERYTGSVSVLGKEWSELRTDRSRQFHLRRIGLIPQDLGLLPHQTPSQMLRQALLDAGVPACECDDRVASALSRMDLDAYAHRRIAELSGGQKQRVAIARVLVRNVELILADEPTANLNPQLSDETIAVLRSIGQTIPVVVVTHDSRVAPLCDRQVRLEAAPADLPAVAPMAAPTRFVPARAARSVPAAPAPAAPAPRLPASLPVPAPPGRPLLALAPYRKLAVLGAAAVSGVTLVALGLTAAFSSPAARKPAPQAVRSPPAATAAPTPAISPTPVAAPTPVASPTPVPPAPRNVAAAPAKVRQSSAVKPAAVASPVAPAPTTPAPATPAAVPAPAPTPTATPGFLQWWLSMYQAFGYPSGTSPQPNSPPPPTPPPTPPPNPPPTPAPTPSPTAGGRP